MNPNQTTIDFNPWFFNNDFCQSRHASKLLYAISSSATEVIPIRNIDPYAKCNETDCTFHVDQNGFDPQPAYIFAFFDGVMDLSLSKVSDDFDIFKCMDLGEGHFSHHQFTRVPIDEVQDLKIKVAPTYVLDVVMSVTLKAFRKVVGYDTFESIRVANRKEKKDPADYYNVTVSVLVKRFQMNKCAGMGKKLEPFGHVLDKGFPYDDPEYHTLKQLPHA